GNSRSHTGSTGLVPTLPSFPSTSSVPPRPWQGYGTSSFRSTSCLRCRSSLHCPHLCSHLDSHRSLRSPLVSVLEPDLWTSHDRLALADQIDDQLGLRSSPNPRWRKVRSLGDGVVADLHIVVVVAGDGGDLLHQCRTGLDSMILHHLPDLVFYCFHVIHYTTPTPRGPVGFRSSW